MTILALRIITIDLMGLYPRTAQGKTGILVITDLFSQWIEAFLIPEVSSGQILTILRTEVMLQSL